MSQVLKLADKDLYRSVYVPKNIKEIMFIRSKHMDYFSREMEITKNTISL